MWDVSSEEQLAKVVILAGTAAGGPSEMEDAVLAMHEDWMVLASVGQTAVFIAAFSVNSATEFGAKGKAHTITACRSSRLSPPGVSTSSEIGWI